VRVRREHDRDREASRSIHVAAFGKGAGEPAEAGLLDALRTCDGWLDRFSLIAEIDGVVVGHSVCTRAFVGRSPVLALGPIAVRPDLQRSGIGHALMHAMIGAADAADEPLIGLLGSLTYYARFGFVPSGSLGIDPPDPGWGEHFQVLPLTNYVESIRGSFEYPAPFDELS
jgi:putative acetyltransferase